MYLQQYWLVIKNHHHQEEQHLILTTAKAILAHVKVSHFGFAKSKITQLLSQ